MFWDKIGGNEDKRGQTTKEELERFRSLLSSSSGGFQYESAPIVLRCWSLKNIWHILRAVKLALL